MEAREIIIVCTISLKCIVLHKSIQALKFISKKWEKNLKTKTFLSREKSHEILWCVVFTVVGEKGREKFLGGRVGLRERPVVW